MTGCIIHYGEIALKGRNRGYFEKRLQTNIKRALRTADIGEITRLRGRFVLHLNDMADLEHVRSGLGHVFGIAHYGFCKIIEADLEKIKATAWQLLKDKSFQSFKVEARRAEKEFHLNSMEINQQVGAYLQERCGKRVDLSHPEIICHVEIVGMRAYIHPEKIQGLRGLPVGVSEKAVSLLSSGIDSPVASYMMLKRGVDLVYVHFHSQPFTNPASKENTADLVKLLQQYQFYSKIYFVPFLDIQKEIMAHAPEKLRVLLYRRYMVRLAERIASLEKARGLVTGESVGQVASQTMSNMRVVAEVTSLPVLRPLCGFDKEEIVRKAKEIGTFEISTRPYEDCCSLFVPENVATKANPRQLYLAEQNLDLEELMDNTLSSAETRIFDYTNRN